MLDRNVTMVIPIIKIIYYYYLFITHKIVARRPNCIVVYNIKTSNNYK